MTVEDVAEWTQHTKVCIAACDKALTHMPDIDPTGEKIFTFKEVAARGKQRFDLRIDMDATAVAGLQAKLANASWLPFVASILGGPYRLWVSVVYSRPGADAQVCTSASFLAEIWVSSPQKLSIFTIY